MLLTQTERLMMSSRPKHPKYARNKNVLVIGGSGSGKTRFFVKPNLMQMHSSYVVTDPKGTVLIECGKLLQRGGYKIKVLNTINFKKSMRYNPFAYLRSEKDILKLVNTIIANTKGDGEKSGEDFWVKSERLFYCALLNLKERRNHLPSQLSGGQQQRVAIGRALITRPSLILADEPTGNLDTQNSSEVIALLKEASRKYEQTIIMITHNRSIAQSADRILQVSDGVLTDLGRCRE